MGREAFGGGAVRGHHQHGAVRARGQAARLLLPRHGSDANPAGKGDHLGFRRRRHQGHAVTDVHQAQHRAIGDPNRHQEFSRTWSQGHRDRRGSGQDTATRDGRGEGFANGDIGVRDGVSWY